MVKFLSSKYIYPLTFAVLYLLPVIVKSQYYLSVLIFSFIYMVIAMSLSIMIGHLGWLSLAHQAFVGMGAYSAAILTVKFGAPFWLGLLAAGLFPAFISLLIGYRSLNLTPIAFAIISLAFLLITEIVAYNWIDVTGGGLGIPRIPRPRFEFIGMQVEIVSDIQFYYFYLTIAIASFALIYAFINSRIGRTLHAIREDETLAEALGVNCFKYKLTAYILSAFLAGIAGFMYAHYTTYVGPDIFDIYFVIYQLIMVMVGGADMLGAVMFSSIAFTFIPEFLRVAKGLREVIYGVILLMIIIYMPEGIGGKMKSLIKVKGEGR